MSATSDIQPSTPTRRSSIPSNTNATASPNLREPSESSLENTVRNNAPASSTPSSEDLFVDVKYRSSRELSAVVEETNRAAIRLGKQPLPVLRLPNGGAPSSVPTNLAEDSKVQEVSPLRRNLPRGHSRDSVSTKLHQRTATESLLQDYHLELRCRYVLHMMCEEDLASTSFSYVGEQGIVIDEDNDTVNHELCPDIIQLICPIEWSEVKKLCTMYPVPFSLNDPNPNHCPAMTNHPSNQNTGPYCPRAHRPNRNGNNHGDNNCCNDNDHTDENHQDLPPHMNREPDSSGDPPGGGYDPSDPDEPSASSGCSDNESEPEPIQVKREEGVA
ncbi:hypothetical protein PQX77_016775 [Marasmius sp. AFHP31]|nr:hypothetical protein PQX77_016775 [Marasmius sp. AFHP31]